MTPAPSPAPPSSPTTSGTKPPKGPPQRGGKRVDFRTTDVVFRALSDASRRGILSALHEAGDGMASRDIAKQFESTWQTVSRHLGVLKEAGLVKMVPHGRDRIYALETAHLQSVVSQWMLQFEGVRHPVDGNAFVLKMAKDT